MSSTEEVRDRLAKAIEDLNKRFKAVEEGLKKAAEALRSAAPPPPQPPAAQPQPAPQPRRQVSQPPPPRPLREVHPRR